MRQKDKICGEKRISAFFAALFDLTDTVFASNAFFSRKMDLLCRKNRV